MLAVATGLDIPIKIVMPHLTADYPNSGCSLLGLGDILIPGIFITFMANFGFEVARTNAYFYAAIIAYTIALFTCGAFLWIFNAAQPALLYIVPALYIAVFSVGIIRGEVTMLKEGIPTHGADSHYRKESLEDDHHTQRLTTADEERLGTKTLEMTEITRRV
jgi:signal peptide peptidase-like protein 2B